MHIFADVLHSEFHLGAQHLLHVRVSIYSLSAVTNYMRAQHRAAELLPPLLRGLLLAVAVLPQRVLRGPLRPGLLPLLLPHQAGHRGCEEPGALLRVHRRVHTPGGTVHRLRGLRFHSDIRTEDLRTHQN